MTQRRALLVLSSTLLTIAAVVTACGSEQLASPSTLASQPRAASQGPGGGSGSGYGNQTPTFLTADPNAPSMANPVITFWAVKGINKEVRMFYHARPGHTDSTTFMWFRIRETSLQSLPDGSSIALGDSVQITVTLVDPVSLKLDFQPSGLRFSPHDSAEIKLSYKETLHDLNGDGVVDHLDADILRRLAVWRQEVATDPWHPLPSILLSGSFEIDAKIGGFTGYAAAY